MNPIVNFRNTTTQLLGYEKGSPELLKIEKALDYVIGAHYHHLHHNGMFFIYHPISVATILIEEAKIKDGDVICAALLHDVFERCDIDVKIFREIFGEKVYSIVDILTKYDWLGLDDLTRTINYVNRIKQASIDCKIIKLADRLDNHRKLSCRSYDEITVYIMKTEEYFSQIVENTQNPGIRLLWGRILEEILKLK
jgi:GTP diphosphokinase / guanosine-3',5'-bis(diphosphate) 3'-diphosphatase